MCKGGIFNIILRIFTANKELLWLFNQHITLRMAIGLMTNFVMQLKVLLLRKVLKE